jgi:hypothetical protein
VVKYCYRHGTDPKKMQWRSICPDDQAHHKS